MRRKPTPSIEFQAHPPERHSQTPSGMLCCGCCCCCCCLHSLGGLIGAAATVRSSPSGGRSGATAYWAWLSAFILLSTLTFGEDGIIVLFLVMPGLQLAASVAALITIALCYGEDKEFAMHNLARMTLWTVLGTLLGVAGMALFIPFLW